MQFESKSVSRILFSDQQFQTSFFPSPRSENADRSSDHSSSPIITDWIKRPTRKLRTGSPFCSSNMKSEIAKCFPIWSCTARSLPGRACHHARRCALTPEISNQRFKISLSLSAAPFHPSPAVSDLRSQNLMRRRLVCFLLHLSSALES